MPFIIDAATAMNRVQHGGYNLGWLQPLRPLIFGPKALLHRYSNVTERALINVGAYNATLNTTYLWPGRLTGSIIDLTYTKVWFQNALLNYFNDYIGVGGTVTAVSGYSNRVRATADIFQTANTFSRSAALYDRDVQIGDIIELRANVSSVAYDVTSTVTGFVADVIASSVGSASSESNNKSTQSASSSISQVSGTPINEVVAVSDGTNYDSLADGYITRTYTITVIQSSTGGDATTARLKIVSADGGDNVASVTPAAFGSPTDIGTKGLKVTFSLDGSLVSSVSPSGDSATDFIIGQQWTCTVNQAFTAPVATAGGTYTGATDTTYQVRVSLGGKYTATTKPQISVSTTTGVDVSGPTNVTASATFVAIGTQGVTIEFSGTALCAGDVYDVPVVAAKPGAVRTIIFQDNLPAGMLSATDMDLRLFIKEPLIQIPAQHSLPSAGNNWTQDAVLGVTVDASINSTDPTLTNSGVLVQTPITSATVFIEYREWDISLAGQIFDFNLRSQVAPVLGTVDPDNPVAYGVDIALQNTPGNVLTVIDANAPITTNVVRCATLGGDPTTTQPWTDVLNLVAGVDDLYNLVPLTNNTTVQAAVANHVKAQSDPNVGFFRACFLQGTVVDPLVLVNNTKTSDGNTALATIAQNPSSTSPSFTLVTVTSANANFITNGVQAGDTVRYLYTIDSFGNTVYSTFTVAFVLSANSLLLTSGPNAAVSTPQRLEIWRTLTSQNYVNSLISEAATYASNRVCLVWPDTITIAGRVIPGYFACAVLAGYVGSIASHQSCKNAQIIGIDSVPRSTSFMTKAQLDQLSNNSVFVISQSASGTTYVTWPVTTDGSTINAREEMVRRNTDMFVIALLDTWSSLIGNANITDYVTETMQARLRSLVNQLKAYSSIAPLGPAVLNVTVNSLGQNPNIPDHMLANLSLTGPLPNNRIDLTVTI